MDRLSHQICPRFQAAIELLGKRWTGLILNVLMEGPLHFNELADKLEVVSDRVLAERLRELERAGVVARTVEGGAPVRVAYALTEKGRDLKGVVGAIGSWAERWINPARPSRRAARSGRRETR